MAFCPRLSPIPSTILTIFVDETLVPEAFRASILNFKPRLGNRCKLFPDSTLFRALILDFKPRLANRCKLFPDYTLLRASILDFRARLANHCSTIVAAVWNGPPATAVAATNSASDSNLRCSEEEWFRLQRQWQRRYSASDTNFRDGKEERPAGYNIAAARKNGPPAE